MTAAATIALAVIFLNGSIDDAIYSSAAVAYLFVPLAFVLPLPQELPRAAIGRRPLLVVGAALTLLLIFWWRPGLAALHANLGAVAQGRAVLSVYEWPAWGVQDEVRRAVDLSPAVAEYEKALALDPENGTARRRLGMIALAQGEYAEALPHLQVAYAADPGDNATRQLLGEAYIVNGDVAHGAPLWASVNNAQGQLDLRYFWYESIHDSERQALVREALTAAGAVRATEEPGTSEMNR
jgi:tetratricopeptide (TPR) repeat protein